MCGEMAGDLRATEILLGLGLDEFSMSAQMTPDVKEKIRSLDVSKAAEKAMKVLAMSDVDEIEAYLSLNSGSDTIID
jgi:phosphotransferase system enzyme I (PtsI)